MEKIRQLARAGRVKPVGPQCRCFFLHPVLSPFSLSTFSLFSNCPVLDVDKVFICWTSLSGIAKRLRMTILFRLIIRSCPFGTLYSLPYDVPSGGQFLSACLCLSGLCSACRTFPFLISSFYFRTVPYLLFIRFSFMSAANHLSLWVYHFFSLYSSLWHSFPPNSPLVLVQSDKRLFFPRETKN